MLAKNICIANNSNIDKCNTLDNNSSNIHCLNCFYPKIMIKILIVLFNDKSNSNNSLNDKAGNNLDNIKISSNKKDNNTNDGYSTITATAPTAISKLTFAIPATEATADNHLNLT